MIQYPALRHRTLGVTAPSSGVPKVLHEMFRLACRRMEERGFRVVCGDTVWTQYKAKSADAKQRADEFNRMIRDQETTIIIPPWGGELLIEMLEYVDFKGLQPKWVLGYSDTSLLLLALTLQTGIATAHGTNLVDLRGELVDETTAMWEQVVTTTTGASIVQHSSKRYQKEWNHENPSPCVFHLTEQTEWKTITGDDVHIEGRLLGGCIDVIRHIIGTPFGDIAKFQKEHIHDEPIVWYFENCELTTTDVRRTLVQMKLAGWFENCSGILFGRSAANKEVGGYTIEDVYRDLQDELQIPIVYDVDCGHVPPQITFVNGAYAEVQVSKGKGTVIQHFKA
ncbi:LD-carboxypeptidase [Ectobacillus sp. JY-23]|uniref:S66 family peptidase n=1 Tax=Ectobacillus sp. JY-23 TaxID=2933872 RepID=UPI001FF654FF|nr:S66 peptidase family protein [Ectobacillus sp. JY-23]UOY92832.1 LD-carboxypeptidase [Ectobacillus sp. JY-23]